MPDLRHLRDTDLADVLTLNERNVAELAPMDETRLHELRDLADRFDVLDVDGAFAGFVITFAPGTTYDSENYRWFTGRHERFYYLDRIVLHDDFRRRGLGSFVYDEMERVAAPYTRLCLEVNLVPPNEPSLAFHDARGYTRGRPARGRGAPRLADGEAAVTPDEVARRSAEAMWADDAASRSLGMEIVDVAAGRATLRMTVREDMVNGHAIGHGGLTFTLADSAFAFACNSYNRSTVAAGAEIRFLAPTRLGDVLVADAVERSREGRDGVYDITVRSGETVVAEFTGRSKEIRGTLFAPESTEEDVARGRSSRCPTRRRTACGSSSWSTCARRSSASTSTCRTTAARSTTPA